MINSAKFYGSPTLKKQSNVLLRTYTGENLEIASSVSVNVCYKEQTIHLPLILVAGSGPSLLGQDWLQHIRLNWKALH